MTRVVLIGIVKEPHADHIVLSEDTRVPVSNGLRFKPGTSVTITFNRDSDGAMVVHEVIRNSMSRAYFDAA